MVAFHSVLCLVCALCLPIELLDPNEIESVSQQLPLDLHVELGIASQRRRQIDLNEPWFEVTINHDVETVQFEAVCAMDACLLGGVVDEVFSRQEGLDYYVVDLRPEEVHIDVDLL